MPVNVVQKAARKQPNTSIYPPIRPIIYILCVLSKDMYVLSISSISVV